MAQEVLSSESFKQHLLHNSTDLRFKEIITPCWISITKSGCPQSGTGEAWDTGETWCYLIVCPNDFHAELSVYKDCLDAHGQQLNLFLRQGSRDVRPLGSVWILPFSDVLESEWLLNKFLAHCLCVQQKTHNHEI